MFPVQTKRIRKTVVRGASGSWSCWLISASAESFAWSFVIGRWVGVRGASEAPNRASGYHGNHSPSPSPGASASASATARSAGRVTLRLRYEPITTRTGPT